MQVLIWGCFPGSSQDRGTSCASHSPLHPAAGAVGGVGGWHMVWGVFSGNSKLGNTIPKLSQVHKLLEGNLGMTALFKAYFQLNFKIVSQNNKTDYCLSLFS